MPTEIADPLLAAKLNERDAAERFIGDLKGVVLERPGQSMSDEEKTLIREKQEVISRLDGEIEILGRDTALREDVRESLARIAPALPNGRPPVQYREASEYVHDAALALSGQSREASDRIARYLRAAEHITTPDTPGIVPDPIVGPILKWIDDSRPIVTALGVRAVPGGPTFHRPVLNDPNLATGVAKQTAEKQELVSKKFTITRVDVSLDTYGGYVNVSRQELDFGSGAMGIIVDQLASRYAVTTEKVAADALAATTNTAVLPATPTSADILKFLYTAAGDIYADTAQTADVVFVSPDVWAAWGAMTDTAGRPLFLPGGSNALGSAAPSSRSMSIGGFAVYMSAGLPPGTAIVAARSAVEVYEQRIGTLSVTEPSVLGVQVAYAGYFAVFINNIGGVVKNALVAGAAASSGGTSGGSSS